jgi:hypothetical protein
VHAFSCENPICGLADQLGLLLPNRHTITLKAEGTPTAISCEPSVLHAVSDLGPDSQGRGTSLELGEGDENSDHGHANLAGCIDRVVDGSKRRTRLFARCPEPLELRSTANQPVKLPHDYAVDPPGRHVLKKSFVARTPHAASVGREVHVLVDLGHLPTLGGCVLPAVGFLAGRSGLTPFSCVPGEAGVDPNAPGSGRCGSHAALRLLQTPL